MNINEKIAALEAFALKHYENGGHWVYETYGREDYLDVLRDNDGDVSLAMQNLHDYWTLMNERRRECAWE